MQLKKLVLFAMVCFLIPALSSAADYKKWIPHLPDTLDGMKATSTGEGMNMDMGDVKMSNFERKYGSGKNQITIMIVYDNSGQQNQALVPMTKLNMESNQGVNKTFKSQGLDAFYQYDKGNNSVWVVVFLSEKATLNFYAPGGKPQKHYTNVVNQIKLKKIAASF